MTTKIFSRIQTSLNGLNGIASASVRLPTLYKKSTDENEIISRWLKHPHTKFTCGRQPLHPNVIQYLLDKKYITTIREEKERSYLITPDREIPVMNQYIFTYNLMKQLRRNKEIKKKYFTGKYIDNSFFKIEVDCKIVETKKRWRIDILICFPNNSSFVIEYLEPHHTFDSEYMLKRTTDLFHSKFNSKKCICVWQKEYSDKKYRKHVLNKIIDTISILENISDDEQFIINNLNKYIMNIELSKTLYQVFNDKNIPILKKEDIITLLHIKPDRVKKLFKKIHDEIKLLQNTIIEDIFTDVESSETESDYEDEELDEKVYYIEKDNSIYYSNYGLFTVIGNISIKDVEEIEHLKDVRCFQHNIAECAYDSIKKIRNYESNLLENIVWGYSPEDY